MTTTPKKILVSFSGGLDSTYLVYDNLLKGNRVTGVYTTIENNVDKTQVEKYQIKQLVKLFEEDFPHQFYMDEGMSVHAQYGNDLIFKQISIWLFSLLYTGGEFDEIQVGAVMNDDMVSYIDDIQTIWQSFAFLKGRQTHPPLTFPIIKLAKWQIVEALPKKYSDLVVYCEAPEITKKPTKRSPTLKFDNCGYCHSCKRYKYEHDLFGLRYGQIKRDRGLTPASLLCDDATKAELLNCMGIEVEKEPVCKAEN